MPQKPSLEYFVEKKKNNKTELNICKTSRLNLNRLMNAPNYNLKWRRYKSGKKLKLQKSEPVYPYYTYRHRHVACSHIISRMIFFINI